MSSSQIQYCQFKSERGNPCRHSSKSKPSIRPEYSPEIGIYICIPHFLSVIEDHMTQLYEARIRNQNFSLDAPIPVYRTFSKKIMDRFVSIEPFPLELPINQCLYKFYTEHFLWKPSNTYMMTFSVENDIINCYCQTCNERDTITRCVGAIDIKKHLLKNGSKPVGEYIALFLNDMETNTTKYVKEH
jgi:hypothetical protein